jgi:response regulator NasT
MTTDSTETKRLLLLDDDRLVLATRGRPAPPATACHASSVEKPRRYGRRHRSGHSRCPHAGAYGYRSGRRLHEADSDVPFIFLTAYSDEELVEQASAVGAMGYVVKPADPDRLVPAIEAAYARAGDARKLRDTGRQLQTALDADRDVSLAIGIMMERRRLGRQEAFELLRGQARMERRKLIELAREIVLAAEKLNLVAAAPVVEVRPRRPEGREVRRDKH